MFQIGNKTKWCSGTLLIINCGPNTFIVPELMLGLCWLCQADCPCCEGGATKSDWNSWKCQHLEQELMLCDDVFMNVSYITHKKEMFTSSVLGYALGIVSYMSLF